MSQNNINSSKSISNPNPIGSKKNAKPLTHKPKAPTSSFLLFFK
jgi:hypothetical protein